MPTVTVSRSEYRAHLAREVASHLNHYGVPDNSWRADSACLGMEPATFFPGQGDPTGPAIAVCMRCPVRVECLTWAVCHGEKTGIWGGTAERTRRGVRRILRASERTAAA